MPPTRCSRRAGRRGPLPTGTVAPIRLNGAAGGGPLGALGLEPSTLAALSGPCAAMPGFDAILSALVPFNRTGPASAAALIVVATKQLGHRARTASRSPNRLRRFRCRGGLDEHGLAGAWSGADRACDGRASITQRWPPPWRCPKAIRCMPWWPSAIRARPRPARGVAGPRSAQPADAAGRDQPSRAVLSAYCPEIWKSRFRWRGFLIPDRSSGAGLMGVKGGAVGKAFVQPPDQRIVGRIDIEGQATRFGAARRI